MDLEYLKSELTKAGWKKLDSGSHMEFDFDLIGVRYFTLTKWNILVKTIPLLNQDTVAQWEDTFKTIKKLEQERMDRLERISKKITEISLDRLAKHLKFDDILDLEHWLIFLLPDDIGIKIHNEKALFTKEISFEANFASKKENKEYIE